jgi:hypothetical protein
LLKYVALIKDEQVRIHRYLSELISFINDKIEYDDPETMEETIRRAKCIYYQQRGRPHFQKAWEGKNKRKIEQRKKGTKPSFFRNTYQGKPTLKEPEMTKTMGKRPRKPPIQCWGCREDHMYRYFPHIGEKVRIVQNSQ